MERRNFPLERGLQWLRAVVAGIVLSFPSATSLADIFRWEDESGVVHFTDDKSSIPPRYRGKSREILKSPPEAGRPSLSTIGPSNATPAAPPAPSTDMGSGTEKNRRSVGEPVGFSDDATEAESLRAKIDAKEKFLRGVDEKQSLAINPYRNRFVSPSDLELYRKYKEELPLDRARLKEIESRLAPPDR